MKQTVYGVADLFRQTMTCIFTGRVRMNLVMVELYNVTWKSAWIIVFCVCFAAVVTIIEASFHMKLVVQDDSLVPGFSVLLIVRELGAVITGLLVASKIGAGYAAQVSLMKSTEQIDALKLLGIDPVEYLTVPRFIGCVIGGALLTLLAILVCLFAAMFVAQIKLGFSPGLFISAMRLFVDLPDLLLATLKGVFFMAVIPIVACFYGFTAESSSEGVGRATTQSVVTSSILIIILDFILGVVLSNFY